MFFEMSVEKREKRVFLKSEKRKIRTLELSVNRQTIALDQQDNNGVD